MDPLTLTMTAGGYGIWAIYSKMRSNNLAFKEKANRIQIISEKIIQVMSKWHKKYPILVETLSRFNGDEPTINQMTEKMEILIRELIESQMNLKQMEKHIVWAGDELKELDDREIRGVVKQGVLDEIHELVVDFEKKLTDMELLIESFMLEVISSLNQKCRNDKDNSDDVSVAVNNTVMNTHANYGGQFGYDPKSADMIDPQSGGVFKNMIRGPDGLYYDYESVKQSIEFNGPYSPITGMQIAENEIAAIQRFPKFDLELDKRVLKFRLAADPIASQRTWSENVKNQLNDDEEVTIKIRGVEITYSLKEISLFMNSIINSSISTSSVTNTIEHTGDSRQGGVSRVIQLKGVQEDQAYCNMNQKMSEIFEKLDPVLEYMQGVFDDFKAPRIVVLGDESSGKSTIMEQLAMFPIFPRGEELTTRMKVELRLRRDHKESHKISVLEKGEEGVQVREGYPMLIDQNKIVNHLQTIWADIDERASRIDDEVEKRRVIADSMLNTSIILEVRLPYVPTLDLVDLPGLTQLEFYAEVSRDLIRQELDNDPKFEYSMYLATIPAYLQYGNTAVAEFIRGIRQHTFGVLTNCDTTPPPPARAILNRMATMLKQYEQPDETKRIDPIWTNGLQNELDMGKGWFFTMLEPLEHENKYYETAHMERLCQTRKNEDDWFANKTEGDPFSVFYRYNQAGTNSLVRALVEEYKAYLHDKWADNTLKLLLERKLELQSELSLLGIPGDNAAHELAWTQVVKRIDEFAVEIFYNDFCNNYIWGDEGILGKIENAFANKFTRNKNNFVSTATHTVELTKSLSHIKNMLKEIVDEYFQLLSGGCVNQWVNQMKDMMNKSAIVEQVDGRFGISYMFRQIRKYFFDDTYATEKEMNIELSKRRDVVQLHQFPHYTDAISQKAKELWDKKIEISKSNILEYIEVKSQLQNYVFLEPGSDATFSVNFKILSNIVLFEMTNCICIDEDFIKSLEEVRFISEIAEEGLKAKYQLEKDIIKCDDAVNGLQKALNISDERVDGLRREVENVEANM